MIRPERQRWDALMREHHYLGMRAIVGEAMRYVASLDGRWVALVGWGAAAFKNHHRDEWIGWDPGLQWRRLKFLANNTRFLILPGVRIPNLASKVLGLNVRRLSQDWQALYGHRLWLVETFVDPSRFKGTCYRAAGWTLLGPTRGFGRNAGRYYRHGRAKMIFVRPLRADARGVLSHPLSRPEGVSKDKEVFMKVHRAAIDEKEGLLDYLKEVPDPRHARGLRHSQRSVLAVAICALLSGARSFVAMGEWASRCSQGMLKRLGCRRDPLSNRVIPPSEPTIRRLLQKIDAEAVDRAVQEWMGRRARGLREEAVAVDGKTLRGSHGREGGAVHLLSAFLSQHKVVVAQREVGEKTNEIPTLKPLLQDVDLKGKVVTADAMHTQKETARFLVEEKEADYLLIVKDNQPTVKGDIESLRMEAFPPSAPDDGQGAWADRESQDLGEQRTEGVCGFSARRAGDAHRTAHHRPPREESSTRGGLCPHEPESGTGEPRTVAEHLPRSLVHRKRLALGAGRDVR
jgi:hypothetical protein